MLVAICDTMVNIKIAFNIKDPGSQSRTSFHVCLEKTWVYQVTKKEFEPPVLSPYSHKSACELIKKGSVPKIGPIYTLDSKNNKQINNKNNCNKEQNAKLVKFN